MRMSLEVLKEAGYEQALLGLSLSYDIDKKYNDFREYRDLLEHMSKVADKLYSNDTGENKFLESMCVWLYIEAPRYWWQQMSTYRVGTSTNSQSTMHTILRNPLNQHNFIYNIPKDLLDYLNDKIKNKEFAELKNILPEGFLQTRIVCTNYKVLRHIVSQRKNHKLPEWQYFINSIYNKLEHPNYILTVDQGGTIE